MSAITPNLFAYFALLSWPLIALCLFKARPVAQALLWTILGAQLLLPVGTSIKFEMIPVFDKSSIATLSALLGCFLAGKRLRLFNGFGTPEVLILMVLIAPFITAELNSDPIRAGVTTLPGISHYDALSAVVGQFIFFVPFLLGRQILRSPDDNRDVLRVLVVAGLLYSLPMLFEVRMSPQLHTWIYGYFPHSFLQQMRDGGFRPVVFIGHGLGVAFFAMTTVVAAAALWRTGEHVFRLPGGHHHRLSRHGPRAVQELGSLCLRCGRCASSPPRLAPDAAACCRSVSVDRLTLSDIAGGRSVSDNVSGRVGDISE